jgi:hypothetical protein
MCISKEDIVYKFYYLIKYIIEKLERLKRWDVKTTALAQSPHLWNTMECDLSFLLIALEVAIAILHILCCVA